MCWHAPELNAVFSGDTLFQGGPGATGRSFSDFPTILESISGRLGNLPGETVVYTGHGDTTTVGDEIVNYDEWVAAEAEPPIPRQLSCQSCRTAELPIGAATSLEDAALLRRVLLLGQRPGIPQRRQLPDLLQPHTLVRRRVTGHRRGPGTPCRRVVRHQLVRLERSRFLPDPRRPRQRGEQREQSEGEETTEQPQHPATRAVAPECQLWLDVPVDGSVDLDVVVALLRNLDRPDPHMHIAVDRRCPADAFGHLRARHAGGWGDAESQVRDRKSACRPAGGHGVEIDGHLTRGQVQVGRARDRHFAVGVVLVENEGIQDERGDETQNGRDQGDDGNHDRDPRREPHGGSLSRLGLYRRANQPCLQAHPQTVAESLPRIGKPDLWIAARTGSVGTENGYAPAVSVSAPSAKKAGKSGGSHGT